MYPDIVAQMAALQPFLAIASAFVLPLLSLAVKRRVAWESFALTIAAINFILSIFLTYGLYASSSTQPLIYAFGAWPPPVGIVYELDRAGALMGLLITGLVLAATIFSLRYMEHDTGVQYYYTLLLGFEAGMLGCVYTGDAFNLFVMLEVMSISAYGLVAFRRHVHEAVEAAIKYAIVGSVATTVYFIAIIFAYGAFGTLNMADLALKLRGSTLPVTGPPLGNVFLSSAVFLALTFWAFSLKAAVAPNHFWLPDAHPAAPSPISALLSGIMVKVAIFALMRYLFTIFRGAPLTAPVVQVLDYTLIVLGVTSAIIGSALMLLQRDIKRLIAYGTILNIGYIAMGMGLGSQGGLTAALFHLVNHAIGKALLFMAAGALIHAAGTRDFDGLAGVGKRMPLTSAAFLIGALALAGAPPLNGFMSKLWLFMAYLETGWLAPLVVVIVVTSVLGLMGYMKAFYHVYARQPVRDLSSIGEAPKSMVAPLLALAGLCILLGLIAPLFVDRVISPAVSSLFDYQGYTAAAQRFAQAIFEGGR